ncbi:hypothetical protein EDB89DRAFT_2217369 [Lactarius sanguifluus]|nr:hypothetical protein EDB89DRAFT_2217369 [Lactarius sanguifluus]
MDLPSSRELELETLLRRKDTQLAELTDEVNTLRQYLSTQPNPSLTEPLSFPPALISLLLTQIDVLSAESSGRSSSSTVNTALAQRTKLLQEENDELYELLKSSETGKLKEEVRGLRRAANRLETALRESHQVIRSLSDELEKSYEIVLPPPARPVNASSRHTHQVPPHMQAPSSANPNGNGHGSGNGNGSVSKPPPTAPRAHKKLRLSEARASPATSSNALPRLQTQTWWPLYVPSRRLARKLTPAITRHPEGTWRKGRSGPPLRNQSGCATENESEDGAETGNVTQNAAYTTGPRSPHVSLVSANASGIGTVIGTGTETVLGTENEIGIGHLVVVVGTVVKVVRAVAVAVVVVEVGMVEATATGHWLREWDSEVLHSGDHKHDQTDLHELTTMARTSQL